MEEPKIFIVWIDRESGFEEYHGIKLYLSDCVMADKLIEDCIIKNKNCELKHVIVGKEFTKEYLEKYGSSKNLYA